MKKILFAQAQYLRKKEFGVLTQLIEDGKQKYISKQAIFPEGQVHIRNTFDNYKLLKNSKNTFLLPETKLIDDKLIIEYIDNPNLAAEIENYLFEGEIELATQKVGELIDFLNTLPIVKANPYDSEEFVKLFDPKKIYFTKEKTTCWYPGFHDTNFDNFIRKDGRYYFVDFEWCFDFPLPKNFLLLRSLFYLSLKFNRTLQTMASPDLPCFNFYHDILVPVAWLDLLDHSTEELQKMLDYEYNLLKGIYVKYDPLERVKSDYASKAINQPLSLAGGAIAQLKHKLELTQQQNALLQNQLTGITQHATNLEKITKQKNRDIKNLQLHVEELREVNRKYQKQSHQIVEKLEQTRLAKSKIVRVLVRKTLSLFIRVGRLLPPE